MRQITGAFWLCALTANSDAAKNLRSEPVAVRGLGYTDYCFGPPEHGMAFRAYNQDGQTAAVLNAIRECGQTVNASACPSNPTATTLCSWDAEDGVSELDIAALTTNQTDPELAACTEPKAKNYCAASTPSFVVGTAIGASVVALLAVISGAVAAAYYKCPRPPTGCANFFGRKAETVPLLEKAAPEALSQSAELAMRTNP